MDATPPARAAGRRALVIDAPFQLRYAALLAGLGVLVPALFGGLMYLAHLDAYRGLDEVFLRANLAVPAELKHQLAEADATLVWLIVAAAVLMGVALALFGLLITHRVAGPVLVMSRTVEKLAQGSYPAMRPLRKDDELQAFFSRLQQAVDAIRAREADEAEQLQRAVSELAPLATSGGALAMVEALRALEHRKRGSLAS